MNVAGTILGVVVGGALAFTVTVLLSLGGGPAFFLGVVCGALGGVIGARTGNAP
jgi:hypothetical protein